MDLKTQKLGVHLIQEKIVIKLKFENIHASRNSTLPGVDPPTLGAPASQLTMKKTVFMSLD